MSAGFTKQGLTTTGEIQPAPEPKPFGKRNEKLSLSSAKRTTEGQLEEYCELLLTKDEEIIRLKEQL